MPVDSPERCLVLVVGSMRSGTSLAAGTLHHLGLHVPEPVLRANTSNPVGFFESVWPVKFHSGLMDRSVVGSVDARPEAFELMMNAVRPDDRAQLLDWLRGEFDGADQVVVKDPRASWVTPLWRDAVETLGGRMGVLLMVRHPAEVVASRATYHAPDLEGERAWRHQVRNLAAWINLTTGVERDTRGTLRVVVRYEDLLADWRRAAVRIGQALDLRLALDVEGEGAHPVDGFVDPSLRRHAPSWSGSKLPDSLIEIAEGVWSALSVTAGDEPADEARERLEALRESFVTEMRVAAAMTYDITAGEVVATRRRLELEAAASTAGTRSRTGRARRLVRRYAPTGIRRLGARLWRVVTGRDAHARKLRAAEEPIVADLRAVGVDVSSVSDLVKSPNPDERALEVLLEHLERGGYPDPVMESLGRALAVKPAVALWDRLRAVYLAARSPGEEKGTAVALAACASKAQLDDLVGFLSITERGASRVRFLRPIKRVGGQRGRDLLESLHTDPIFGRAASALLFQGATQVESTGSLPGAAAPDSGRPAKSRSRRSRTS